MAVKTSKNKQHKDGDSVDFQIFPENAIFL